MESDVTPETFVTQQITVKRIRQELGKNVKDRNFGRLEVLLKQVQQK